MGKGGVGKSLITLLFAYRAQEAGQEPIILQLDSQYNVESYAKQLGISHLKIETIDWQKAGKLYRNIIDNTPLKNLDELIEHLTPELVQMIGLLEFLSDHPDSSIYIDFPPNAQSLQLLQLPQATDNLLYKIVTMKNQIKKLVTGKDIMVDTVKELKEKFEKSLVYLKTAEYYILSLPEAVPIFEGLKMKETLLAWGIPSTNIKTIFNRVRKNTCHIRTKFANEAEKYIKKYQPDFVFHERADIKDLF